MCWTNIVDLSRHWTRRLTYTDSIRQNMTRGSLQRSCEYMHTHTHTHTCNSLPIARKLVEMERELVWVKAKYTKLFSDKFKPSVHGTHFYPLTSDL